HLPCVVPRPLRPGYCHRRDPGNGRMTGRKVSFTAAAKILAGRDPVIARLVAEAGLPRLGRPTETHLGTLVRAVVYQQLAGRAAAAIHGRLLAAMGGDVSAEALLALSDEQMR